MSGIGDRRAAGARTQTALLCSATGALGAYAAVAWAANARGRSVAAPANATSHWLQGPQAGAHDEWDAAHTGVGLATHVASAAFWAAPYVMWNERNSSPTFGSDLRTALATAAVAAVLDYGILPRRLSPGWHLVLPPRHVAAGFVGLGLGLAAGAWLARELFGTGHRRA